MRAPSLFASIFAAVIFFSFLTASPSVIEAQETRLMQFMRDSATLGFANALLKEGLNPLSYDGLLDLKQNLADTQSGTIRITKLSAFGQVVGATGNDPVTFYIDEDYNENIIKKIGNEFLYGWEIAPPDFGQCPTPPPIPNTLLWPVPGGAQTDPYGCSFTKRSRPCPGGSSWFHNGYDIAILGGTNAPVTAAADGKVLRTGTDASYGNWVVIEHAALGVSTVYNHLSSISVRADQNITKGQSIGNTGSTGFVTGDHLHFMVYPGTPIFVGTTHTGCAADPYPYLSSPR